MNDKDTKNGRPGSSRLARPHGARGRGLGLRTAATNGPLPEVVVGVLKGFDEAGAPTVELQGASRARTVAARTTIELSKAQVGSALVLAFEEADPSRPIVLGVIRSPNDGGATAVDQLVLTAGREIVLRVGKASITLSKDGKVTIRGEYLVSRASGVNRIKGGSVQIN